MAERGRVRFISDRGFAFIIAADDAAGQQDRFFHRGDLQGTQFDAVHLGQLVEYEVVTGPKGPRAIAVRVVPE